MIGRKQTQLEHKNNVWNDYKKHDLRVNPPPDSYQHLTQKSYCIKPHRVRPFEGLLTRDRILLLGGVYAKPVQNGGLSTSCLTLTGRRCVHCTAGVLNQGGVVEF